MRVHHFPVIDSTNAEAIRRAKTGGEEGEVFIADRQTDGRGRMGRKWDSPEGKNIYLSFLLKPKVPPSKAPLLTLVAGEAVFETLFPLLPDPLKSRFRIKWPNDLYLQDKKVAGILTEAGSSGGEIDWVVVGIGINVNADPSDFSPEVRKIATSLKIAIDSLPVQGGLIDREKITSTLIETFEKRYFRFCKDYAPCH
jgi:BirA family biotin operon repressor/biotin-[acetyl-CoA-carboxylase] ligase